MTVEAGPNIKMSTIALNIDFSNIKYISGNTISDGSGNSYPVSIINSGSNTATIANGYCTFTPTDATSTATYFQINDSNLITGYSELSLETIVYLSDMFAQNYQRIRPVSPRVTETGCPLGFSIGTDRFSIEMSGTGSGNPGQDVNGYYTASNILNSNLGLNKWAHITQTVSTTGQQFKTYINGILAYTITNATGPSFWGGILIGRGFYGGVSNFSGRVGFVRVYKTALTATEVSNNFDAIRGRYGI